MSAGREEQEEQFDIVRIAGELTWKRRKMGIPDIRDFAPVYPQGINAIYIAEQGWNRGGQIDPIGVWDATSKANCLSAWWFNLNDALDWTRKHIPNPERTYMVVFYRFDTAWSEIYRYATNSEDCVYHDASTGKPFLEPPERLLLNELPSEHLLRGCPVALGYKTNDSACDRYGWAPPLQDGWPSLCGVIGTHGTIIEGPPQ